MIERQRRPGEVTHGLYVKRPRTCPCGAVFTARTPTATYCTNDCRRMYGRYGGPKSVFEGERAAGA